MLCTCYNHLTHVPTEILAELGIPLPPLDTFRKEYCCRWCATLMLLAVCFRSFDIIFIYLPDELIHINETSRLDT